MDGWVRKKVRNSSGSSKKYGVSCVCGRIPAEKWRGSHLTRRSPTRANRGSDSGKTIAQASQARELLQVFRLRRVSIFRLLALLPGRPLQDKTLSVGSWTSTMFLARRRMIRSHSFTFRNIVQLQTKWQPQDKKMRKKGRHFFL
jgi:hypothetical protein